jgi:hypothetical protein
MMIFDILNLHCDRYRKEYVVEPERMMCFIRSVIWLFTGEVNAKYRKYKNTRGSSMNIEYFECL